MIPALLLLFVACLVAGLWLLRRARAMQAETGLPDGEVVYVDAGGWERVQQPLFSDRYRLSGRPDYLVRQDGRLVPVEVKSPTGLKRPRTHHVAQLMTYCLLVEETESVAPSHGLLHYPDVTFRIRYTPERRTEVLKQLARLRRDLSSHDVRRSHSDPGRCRHCGMRHACSQSL